MHKAFKGSAAFLLAALVVAGAPALADDAASAPAPAAAAIQIDPRDAVPQHNCTKPALPPKLEPTAMQVERFNKGYKTYRDCIQTYIDARRTAMKYHNELANQNADAAHAAADEINKFTDDAKAWSGNSGDSDN